MRNIALLNTTNFWGGGEKFCLTYALGFNQKEYNVILFAKENSPLFLFGKDAGLKVIAISGGNLAFINPKKTRKLKSQLVANDIDTLIMATSEDAKFGGVVAQRVGVENIVYYRALAAPVRGSRFNKKLFNNKLTHIVANSEATKELILQNMKEDLNPNKIKVIYYGIKTHPTDLDCETKLATIAANDGTIVLGNAGRLTSQKGQKELLEIASILKKRSVPFKLYIAGTGELYDELSQIIIEKGLENHVVLLGFVEDMEAFMNSIDVFVLSSLWEGFGFVIVEAMIKEKPAIAFDLSSNPEIISNGKTGFIVSYPNYENFADKIQLLVEDKQLRMQMGKQAKDSVIDRFDSDERISELETYLLNS